MTGDVNAIPTEAIEAAAEMYDAAEVFGGYDLDALKAALTAAAPLLRAPLEAEIARLRAENDTLRATVEAVEKRHAVMRTALSVVHAWPDGVTGKRMVDAEDILTILDIDRRAAAALGSPSGLLVDPSGGKDTEAVGHDTMRWEYPLPVPELPMPSGGKE